MTATTIAVAQQSDNPLAVSGTSGARASALSSR